MVRQKHIMTEARFMTKAAAEPLPDLWNDAHAADLDEPGLLLYRSNLLGSDLRITNFGGGNTSAKLTMTDPLTQKPITVLWVKGSGGDLGSMKRDGFSTLYLDKLESLKQLYHGIAHEDEMVALFNHCTFNLNPRATSIDTALHGFVPHTHVDHLHADAVIAIAACSNAEELTGKVFGGTIGFLPWQRPGFDLGLKLGAMAAQHPEYVGVVLGGHALFTWGPTSKAVYQTTLRIIQQAADWLAGHEKQPAFGGPGCNAAAPEARRASAAALMPLIRGKISRDERKVGHFTDAPEVLEFVNSRMLDRLAPLGTSCPDHFLRTKIRPLVLPYDHQSDSVETLANSLDGLLEAYRDDYSAYYQRCKRPNSPAMRDPNAVIYLVPGIGMFSFAKDKATARIRAIVQKFGRDSVVGIALDVTDEASVVASFHESILAYGGIDVVVSNAGIASASPVEDTSLALWQKNMDVLATGYFLVAREAFRLMQRQQCGGAIVFVASKNGLAASAGASAYCAAKASEIHLARCLALEGAPHGIRVNTVNPDAVLRGSKIWAGEWRQQRAASNKVSEDELEEVYRQRSMLKLSVLPEDIAEGIYFFASDLSAKSTGNILNVDAGNAQAFTR